MAKTIAILIFDGAKEMDFVGPWEVFAAAIEDEREWRIVTIAASRVPIVCEKGMRVIPSATYADIQNAEVVVIPGGSGARREIDNPKTVQWLRSVASQCRWITSVCTGAFLMVGSGLAHGRKVTTHHDFLSQLREFKNVEVVEGVRMVRDGKFVSAGGVMSGIEMSLWLVEQTWGKAAANRTRNYIAYDHPPRSSILETP